MYEIKNLRIMTLTNRVLIDNIDININEGDKIAVIGEEGNGKSTLLRAIKNDDLNYVLVSGQTLKQNVLCGYLPQFLQEKYLDYNIDDYLLLDERDEICYENYNQISEMKKNLETKGLECNVLNYNKTLRNLSGGEKVKIQIIKLMMKNYDIYLLDEPTNDLDLETIVFLENFIRKTDIPIVFISHDETLLENVSNKIIHIESFKKVLEVKTTVYTGNYKEYIEYQKTKLKTEETEALRNKAILKKKEERMRQLINKVQYQQNQCVRNPELGRLLKKKMHVLKSSEKRIKKNYAYRMPLISDSISIFFDENIAIPTSKVILDLKDVMLFNDNRYLTKPFDLNIIGPKKITIIGKNGVGKTTLVKFMLEKLKETKNINIGYFPQNYEEVLDFKLSPLAFLMRNFIDEEEYIVRNYLGSMRFTKEEVQNPIMSLSGGQKAKIILIDLVLRRCDVLLLDEITRNFSPISNPIIRNILSEFNGTVISITHDRKYILEVSDEIYELTKEGLIREV